MKILMIGPFPNPITGQSIANETLFKGLKEKGYRVEKIDTNFFEELEDKKKQGKFSFRKICIILKNLYEDYKTIKKNEYDVVYMTPGGTYLGIIRFIHYIFLGKNNKIYLHFHNGAFRKVYENQGYFGKKILNFILKKSQGVIVLGESLKSMFYGIIPENKIFVCENGVQDEVVATEEEIEEKIKRYEKDNKKRVLYLSNLMIEKGILDLLKVSENFTDEEIEFNLAGAIEPSIKDKIEEYLNKYPNKIKYHGIVSGEKKKKLFLENYIFILPTYYSNEGQPISILEAYANGCAVITDENIGGIKDIFKDKANGLSIQSKNIRNIQTQIKEMMELKFMQKNYIESKQYKKSNFIKKIEKIIKN